MLEHPKMKKANVSEKKQFNAQTFVIENAEEPQGAKMERPPMPEHLRKAQPQEEEEKMVENTAKKTLLQDLIFLGSAREEVDVNGVKFAIRTLTHEETGELLRRAERLEQTDTFTIRTLTLATVIEQINGIAFDTIANDLDGADQYETMLDRKVGVLCKMQRVVVNHLYVKYVELSDRSENQFSGEEVKNS